jgi:hypothetical protein
MKRVFHITQGFTVPDGTMVYPFLNSKDSTSDIPWDLVDNVSLAVGDIAPAIGYVYDYNRSLNWFFRR